MNILFWGLTISVLGKISLVIGVIMAHHKIAKEHRIDKGVIKTFRIELVLSIIGILLIVFGYGLEIYFYHFTELLTCSGAECATKLEGITQ